MAMRSTLLAAAVVLAAHSYAWPADPPDFSGSWRLDPARSDDVKARVEEAAGPAQASGGTSPLTILPVPGTKASVERVEMREAMLKLVGQLDHLEIEHQPTEIKLFHGDEIARTFYFGRESFREDFMGRKLKCRTKWKDGQLTLEEEGDKGRRRVETLTLVPSAGLLIEAVRWEDGLLKKPLEVRLVYTREPAAGKAQP
jgi:hypothetical protein